jgi:hypothetical protein
LARRPTTAGYEKMSGICFAVKFTAQDAMLMSSSLESFAEVEVRDTGIGIDADFLP